MRIIVTLILTLLLSLPTTLWANQPKILTSVPNLEIYLRNGASGKQIQDLVLKHILAQAQINNIHEYAVFLKEKLAYKKESVDVWSAPLQTLARGFGDCEDLSFLTAAVLEHFGHKPLVLGFKRSNEAHVFVLAEIEGVYYIFDNTQSVKSKIHSVNEVAAFLHEKYNIEYLLEVRRAPNQIRLLYSKAQLQQLAKK